MNMYTYTYIYIYVCTVKLYIIYIYMYYMYTLKYEVSRMGTPGGVDHKVLKLSPGMIVELYPL